MSHLHDAASARLPTDRPSKWMRAGKMRPAVLLWALGVPIPLILIFFLIRGCM